MNARGMALITGLLLLAAISLLALVGVSGMILQRHMSTNFKNSATALQNADFALSEGRAWLFSRANHEREPNCVTDCLLPAGIHAAGELPARVEFETQAWWRLNAIEAGLEPETGRAGSILRFGETPAPRWIIEEMHFQPLDLEAPTIPADGVGYYRIFARGVGVNLRGIAVTEAIVARPWGEGITPQNWPGAPGNSFCEQVAGIDHPGLDCGTKAWRQRR